MFGLVVLRLLLASLCLAVCPSGACCACMHLILLLFYLRLVQLHIREAVWVWFLIMFVSRCQF